MESKSYLPLREGDEGRRGGKGERAKRASLRGFRGQGLEKKVLRGVSKPPQLRRTVPPPYLSPGSTTRGSLTPPSGPVTKLDDLKLTWLVLPADNGSREDSLGSRTARRGVTPWWLRRLLPRGRHSGVVPRLNPRRRPPAPPLTEAEQQAIEGEHRRSFRGATKLWRALKCRGIRIAHGKVYRYACSREGAVPNPRKQRPRDRCRYEREHTGSLLYTDFHRTSLTHPHVILYEDDASRMVRAGEEFPEQSTAHAIEVVEEAIAAAATWGLAIRELNTHRGPEFLFTVKVDRPDADPGQFQQFLAAHGIRHVVSRLNNPQTKDYPAYCTSREGTDGISWRDLGPRRFDHLSGALCPS